MLAMVVDDSRAMRSLLRQILVPLGVEIVEAAEGRAAVDLVESGPVPDLALVDWHMPVMDGLELVTELRSHKEWRHMAIMMVTTESEHENMVRALLAGANEYLIKPFTADAVVEKLSLLGLHCATVPAGDPYGGGTQS
ncbi:MAG TPA: response regulator [Acidimicrobiales bacterium]|nr:response regulator [Acidimicrobiales bacterium]